MFLTFKKRRYRISLMLNLSLEQKKSYRRKNHREVTSFLAGKTTMPTISYVFEEGSSIMSFKSYALCFVLVPPFFVSLSLDSNFC